MNAPTRFARPQGFALIVTLSLMILLTVIAVGLLSLSSISLRAAGQSDAMATARANARLGLMLALGDLQKTLGPDRAITATSEILTAGPDIIPGKPNTTGVWQSWWDFNPAGSTNPDYVGEKTSRFRRWLVSSADVAATESKDFGNTAWTAAPKDLVELVGNGSLGANATTAAKVTAGLVPVSKNGKTQGAYAWHVADESVKARINTYRDPSQNSTLAQKRALLAGHRPDPSVMKGADGSSPSYLPTDLDASKFALAKETTGKILDLDQVELLDNAKGKTKQFRNDVTPYSLGLLTDVRRGGLKQDLSSVFEMSSATSISLPAEFTGTGTNPKKLYQSTHGITGISDPHWTNLAGYYNTFRSVTAPDGTPTLVLPSTVASLTANKVPQAYFAGPVIAKVETVFSLVTREVTSSWMGMFEKPEAKNYDYTVNLVFSPVITLHNPYNVAISFHSLKVTLNNVPVAFNFSLLRGGAGGAESQSVTPGNFESLNEMIENDFIDTATGVSVRRNKKFVVNIANWTDTTPATTTTNGLIVMKPGQTLSCQPYINPNASFLNDSHNLGANTEFFDYNNTLTPRGIKAKPGAVPGLGFEINNVTPSQRSGKAVTGIGRWFFLLRDSNVNPAHVTDKFFVEYKVQQPRYWTGGPGTGTLDLTTPASFSVDASLKSTASSTAINYALLKFDYTDESKLKDFFTDRVFRCPPTGNLSGGDTFVPAANPIRDQPKMRPFAIFSAYARTTNGGVYETDMRVKAPNETPLNNLLKDGRLAGKPFLFHNPSRSIVTMDLATSKPGSQPYELNFQSFLNRSNYEGYMDISGDRVPALTANTTARGIKSGSYLEIPTGPMQTIADFRRSNTLTSSYLPHFVQPVGNSLLHPLMSANRVVENDSAISTTALLDHSVLANHALYDRFYFSTFATRGTETPDTVFEKFMTGIAPLASQVFQPYLPTGKTVTTAKAELFSSGKPKNTAYQTAAEYQMVQAPFNVNSTNVQAWKAVLASMNKSEVATLWAKVGTFNKLNDIATSKGIPILGMSLHNGGLAGGAVDSSKIDDVKTNDWNGYREIDDAQLTNLATKIVAQVRLRGPFLSMSEFVNRQIGSESDLTLSGALEKAIFDAELNKDTFRTTVTTLAAADFSDTKLYNYKTPAATIGNPAAGAPGWISQGDLLRILEPAATVRSDTFVIRVCGEAQDASGKITARAFAEAVVQRVPEYVDPVDRPSLNAYDITVPAAVPSTAAVANKAFGRRMNVVSFRWLASNEI